MSINTPPITPQQYEVLHGGGAEAAEIAKQRLSRRRFLRRSMLAVWGLSATAAVGGALYMMYPNLAGQFGSDLTIGVKSDFKPAKPLDFQLNQAGIFYHQEAKTYISVMAADTDLRLHGSDLTDQLHAENFVKDENGNLWVALYQRCVHLGCTVPYRNECYSFKCPCHGSHYNVNGEYLSGPAPRSLDRFALTLGSGPSGSVTVSTGTLNNTVPHPDPSTQIINPPPPTTPCGV